MRRFLNGLLIGIILGAVGYWYVEKRARQNPEAESRFDESAARAGASTKETMHDLSDALKAKLDALNLKPDEIRDELDRTGKVVRRKAKDLGTQVEDAAGDARIVADIKSKYLVDQDLSVWKISASSDQGHVTLSGTVSAPEFIGKAVALALDVDGVRDVTSNLEVKPQAQVSLK